MIKYEVRFEKNARKSLKKMDPQQSKILLSWINKHLVNSSDPRIFGRSLIGNHKGKWRYRVGDYRLICNISDTTVTILVLEIGHRKDIYK